MTGSTNILRSKFHGHEASHPEHYRGYNTASATTWTSSHQLFQVFLVGLTLGMMRTVIPALAESEFGVPKGSFMLLMAFVVAFGFVKGALNFVAGRLSERYGRKTVLLLGWAIALPIPFMIYFAPSWNWIVAATVLLGVNQGFTWSMTQTAKLDITRADQRGLTIGLNEFAGYVGVAIAGILTGYLATAYGPRLGLFIFGAVVTLGALVLTALWVKETLPWAKAEGARHAAGKSIGPKPRFPKNISDQPSTWEVFTLMSWRDKRMAALPSRPGGKIRRCANLGVLSGVLLSAGHEPGANRLDGRHIWFRMGRLAVVHRQAV